MKEILDSIKDTHDANALIVALDTGIFYDKAPPNAAFPYATYNFISDLVERFFGGWFYDDMLLQFSLFSNSRSVNEISNFYGRLNNVYDEITLDIEGFTNILLRRENTNWPIHLDGIWQMSVDYRCLIAEAGFGESGFGEGGFGGGTAFGT